MLVTGSNDLLQACQRSPQVRLRVVGRIRFLCVSTVQHAQYGEIERGSGISEENFQVAAVEGGTASQRRLLQVMMIVFIITLEGVFFEKLSLQRLDVLKASGTETHSLGNQ